MHSRDKKHAVSHFKDSLECNILTVRYTEVIQTYKATTTVLLRKEKTHREDKILFLKL